MGVATIREGENPSHKQHKRFMVITKGQCFTFRFSEDNIKGYFFTGIIDKGTYVMCEMVLPHQMNDNSFWKMTESFFEEAIESVKIELI